MLEARHADWGVSMEEVAALIWLSERLILEQSVDVLSVAYNVSGHDMVQSLTEQALEKVLATYLLLFETGEAGEDLNASMVDTMLEQVLASEHAPYIQDMEHDAIYNFDFIRRHATNPFTARSYPFEIAEYLMRGLAGEYGKEQNVQCRQMKDDLMMLARQHS